MTSLRGGEPFAPLPAGFRRLLWPPLPEHSTTMALDLVAAGPFDDFVEILLERKPLLPCSSFVNSGP